MDSNIFININDHIKNEFTKNVDVVQLSYFPNQKELQELDKSKVYELSFACLAVDVVQANDAIEKFGIEQWNKIYREYLHGVCKILNSFNVKHIRVAGDSVVGIFPLHKRTNDYENLFECAICINTFKSHLNKNISKLFFNREWQYGDIYINFGIGIHQSDHNFFWFIGKYNQDINFAGDAISFAVSSAKMAARTIDETYYETILFDEVIMSNFSFQYLNDLHEVWSLSNYSVAGRKYCGCDIVNSKYAQMIKNNF